MAKNRLDGKRILIVDDEPDVLEALQELLSTCHVETAASFEEAKEELKIMDQDFLAFRNAETQEINVIRKEKKDFKLLRAEKELMPEEAVEELKKSGESLLFFNNKSTRIPAIVFRRKSGNFGLIEPEA